MVSVCSGACRGPSVASVPSVRLLSIRPWFRGERFPFNRGGNRRRNVALSRIGTGDTKNEAIRALRRPTSGQVYRRMLVEQALPHAAVARTGEGGLMRRTSPSALA